MATYLLHFEKPINGAQHYLGACAPGNLERRLQRHSSGQGASLTRRAGDLGIGFYLARQWDDGDFELERKLKTTGHYRKHCPICTGPFWPPFIGQTYYAPRRSRKPVIESKDAWDGLNWVA
jgi:predicted GIY-YIG superfamily endonuclease